MYEMSEMATLMEQMYVDNKRLKERIKKGDTIGTFPKHFLKIFTAKFTDETENDLFFKQKAKDYITVQQLIYRDPKNAIKHFNTGVDACLKCHESKFLSHKMFFCDIFYYFCRIKCRENGR